MTIRKPTFTNFILLAIIVGILIFWIRGCGSSDGTAALTAANKTLQIQHKEDSIDHIRQQLKFDIEASAWDKLIDKFKIQRDSTQRLLDQSTSRIQKLIAAHAQQPEPKDTGEGFVIATKEWADQCDDCFSELKFRVIQDSVNKSIIDSYALSLDKRESACENEIKAERISYDTLNSRYNKLQGQFNAAMKLAPRKNSLWIGLGGIFSTPMSGVGAYIQYQTPRKQYTFGGGMNNHSTYYIEGKLGTCIICK